MQAKPKLKAILCGHTHIAEVDGFSETARMYVAGGNYEGRAYEIGLFCIMGHGHRNGKRRTSQLSAA